MSGNLIAQFGFIGNITPPNGVPSDPSQFGEIISAIISIMVVVAFLTAFILLLIGGIAWITSGGDEKALMRARGRITAALIGLVLVLSSIVIMKLLEYFFNVPLLRITIAGP